jgi:hypothetical protein
LRLLQPAITYSAIFHEDSAQPRTRHWILTAEEYLAVAEQRFNAANPDKDGTVDAKKLKTSAKQALLQLVR